MKKLLLMLLIGSALHASDNNEESVEKKVAQNNTELGRELIQVIKKGNRVKAKELLEKGACVKVGDWGPHGYVASDWTALMYASLRGYNDIVELLIQKGADINAHSDYRETALMEASIHGHISIVELLIKNGADVNAKAKFGNTALLHASYWGYKDIVEILLKEGADVNAEDSYGETSLTKASQSNRKELVKLLEKWIQYNKEYENDKNNGFKNCVKSITLTNYLIGDLAKIVLEYLEFIDWMKCVHPEEFA